MFEQMNTDQGQVHLTQANLSDSFDLPNKDVDCRMLIAFAVASAGRVSLVKTASLPILPVKRITLQNRLNIRLNSFF